MKKKETSKDKWLDYWRKKYVAECEKVAGYEELAKMHSAYITILLNKLGATEDNMLTITLDEVKEALEKYEARAKPAENGYGLYCEVIAEE
jgi:hypothetical protein